MFKNTINLRLLCLRLRPQHFCLRNFYLHHRRRNEVPTIFQRLSTNLTTTCGFRGKKDDSQVSALFRPVPVKPGPDDINVGAELTGNLDKAELLKILNKFTQKKEIRMLCMENGLDSNSNRQLHTIVTVK